MFEESNVLPCPASPMEAMLMLRLEPRTKTSFSMNNEDDIENFLQLCLPSVCNLNKAISIFFVVIKTALKLLKAQNL